ncbi:MAG: threonine--tRNA ligase [bacterium]|nr:threonine--tRNA ligase [bacterium]
MNLEHTRHSLSHLLAAAVLDLYPNAKPTLGPAIETGFYYDFEFSSPVGEEDLKTIEAKMRELLPTFKEFVGKEVSEQEAREYFKDNPYKQELMDGIVQDGSPITLYTAGSFTDLCRGGHAENLSTIDPESFTLSHISGAYWRGDEKNIMLTRIYGLAFETKENLQAHLTMIEEAKKRDHRKLGKDLGLFVFSDLIGPGLPVYAPKGTTVLRAIQGYSKELRDAMGYQEVHTPQMNKADLFKTSGHYEKYREDMFRVHSNYTEEEYYLKPMNCPQHTQVYASQTRSYRDLPVRIADFANLYRDEKPGELSGLTRLRAFSQDDGHCFCREDQIQEEFAKLLDSIRKAMETYGMNYWIRLSLRDEEKKDQYLGEDATWEKSQALMKNLLKEQGIPYKEALGEAAFYGPKMDLIAKDSLGREWQLSTIQLDFTMPERFNLEYVDEEGKRRTPIMIHSAIAGSAERFLGVLIEHHAGAFPLWLSPEHAWILPVSDKFNELAHNAAKALREASATALRVVVRDHSETLGKKIREGEQAKIPYLFIVGEKEEKEGTFAVRKRGKGDIGTMKIEAVAAFLHEEIKSRAS